MNEFAGRITLLAVFAQFIAHAFVIMDYSISIESIISTRSTK